MSVNTEVRDVLVAARERIADEKNWTQYTAAKDSKGDWCDPHTAAAVCWCATGAVMAAIPVAADYYGLYTQATAALKYELIMHLYPTQFLVEFNDHPERTHAEVLALFDRTIRRFER